MVLRFKLRLLLLLCTGLYCFHAYGQDRERYKGLLQLNRYSGEAEFEYVVSDTDTIYDGGFQFQRSSMETALQKKDTSFVFQGSFDQGIATGPWQFQFNEFQSEQQGKLVDFEYRILVSGVQEKGDGKITDGRPDGEWLYQVNKISASEIESILFKSAISFDDGVPQQSFKIESDSTVLVGRFLRNGLAHDEWSSFAKNSIADTENWFFEEGILKRIVRVIDGKSEELSVFDAAGDGFKTIPMNGNYLKVVQSALLAANKSLSPRKGIAGLLARNQRYYDKLHAVLSGLGSSGFSPQYRAKVPYHPLDSMQLKQLNTIEGDYVAAKAIATMILTNSHLNIVRRSDAEVNYRYRTVATIERTILNPLKPLVSAQKEGIVEYLELPEMLGNIWPDGTPSKEVEVAIDSVRPKKSFVLPNSGDFDFSGNDLGSLSEIARYARASMENIKEALSGQLTTEESIRALNSLEVDLIAKNDSLKTLIETYQKSLPKQHKNALKAIADLAETSLQRYATTTEPEQKLVFGNTFDKCMEQLLGLTRTIGTLPARVSKIDSLYTDVVFNPFMATVMEEDVKKRITKAYSDIVIPYFLEEVTDDISCKSAERINLLLKTIHNRVVALRKKDTKKLERKLRREKRPEEVLKLFKDSGTTKATQE